jgi:Flp pilus assembly protein TadG
MGPQDHRFATDLAGLRSAARAARARLAGGRLAARGQMLVLFVVSIFVLTGITAIVVDVSWYWANSLRVQRAADAAALAGVVWLPGNPTSAYSTARAEATKNGYDNGTGGTVVTPTQDATNKRRLNVTISSPVGTFFMKIFGIATITAIRSSKAEYVLPVPMGSPENYYGVFGLTRGLTSTTDVTTFSTSNVLGDSGWGKTDTTTPGASVWTASSGTLIASVQSNNNNYARTTTNNAFQQWSGFGLQSGGGAIPNPGAGQVLTIVGLQVRLTDAWLSATCAGSTIKADLSWNNGTSWSTAIATPSLPTPVASAGTYTLPAANGSTSTAAWGAHTWVLNDFTDTNFRARLQAVRGCATTPTFNVDMLEVRVWWNMATTTSTTTTVQTNLPDQNLQGPGTACSGIGSCNNADGAALNPRGFWATMNTEGAENINGDAFQPYYDTATSTTNPAYDGTTYYNYAVEIPAGASGSVYVYDPGFCATAANKGTGDRWFTGAGANVSSFYELYDTKNTLYDMTDDGAPVANSSGLFRNIGASDTTMGGSGGSECKTVVPSPYGDGRDYHDKWWVLASGLSGGATGKVYRIHTTSTDPSNVAAQRTVNGENSFALYSSIPGSRIYGLGAMQMFTPLTASGSAVTSEFYLAQLDAVHAGKTVEIMLWDPGDTFPLSASLEILVPTAAGWTPTSLDYTAAQGTTNANAASCNALTGTGVTSIVTNVGPTNGTFNGCWLTIQISIPTTYTAPQSGWWKIRYTMNGSGTSNDVTTWKVQIRGNPVHLIVP